MTRPLPFDPATMLAPMEGLSHATFRGFVAELGGVGAVCTEFVRITNSRLSARQLRQIVTRQAGTALSVQVMGRDVERMAEAARLMSRAGADIVDINLGCPTPRAVRGGVGAAMLRDLGLLERVLAAMRAEVSGCLSAKIRAGFSDTSGALEIARRVENAGTDFLVVHPRRRSDVFRGVADWRIIREIKQHLSIPVVGNGDCWYAADIARMREETGCDAVMIGRPALRNPWIFRQAEQLRLGQTPVHPDGDAVADRFERMTALFRDYYEGRERPLLGKLKEILHFAARALPDPGAFLAQGLRLHSIAELKALFDREVRPLSADSLDLSAKGSGGEQSGSASPGARSSTYPK